MRKDEPVIAPADDTLCAETRNRCETATAHARGWVTLERQDILRLLARIDQLKTENEELGARRGTMGSQSDSRTASSDGGRAQDRAEPQWHIDHAGDYVCEHGTAIDVHCCNCHSGFRFDLDHECPEP